jgi:hypothetical protein
VLQHHTQTAAAVARPRALFVDSPQFQSSDTRQAVPARRVEPLDHTADTALATTRLTVPPPTRTGHYESLAGSSQEESNTSHAQGTLM